MQDKNITPTDENNRPHGYWERYYTNGELWYKGNFIHGREDGYWETYWYGGEQLFKGYDKGYHIHGQKYGYWEHYNISTKLKRKQFYAK